MTQPSYHFEQRPGIASYDLAPLPVADPESPPQPRPAHPEPTPELQPAQATEQKKPDGPLDVPGVAPVVRAPAHKVPKARTGWRGKANHLGLTLPPSQVEATRDRLRAEAEESERRNRMLVQQPFRRPMTAAVLNTKGGAGKTPTTVSLASAFGVHRGGSSVAWCANETHGTLATRTEDGGLREDVWDLLQQAEYFESATARFGDLGRFLRPQGDSRFDALVSSTSPELMLQITREDCLRIHRILTRFYRTVLIDTGNNLLAESWQAAVDASDVIVIVADHTLDSVQNAILVLNHLEQTGRSDLARNAVGVITSRALYERSIYPDPVDQIRARISRISEVPFDAAIASGGPIRWHDLSPLSRLAWTHAAANLAQAFAQNEADINLRSYLNS